MRTANINPPSSVAEFPRPMYSILPEISPVLIEILDEELAEFSISVTPAVGIVTVYRKRDVKIATGILYCLCYHYAVHEVSGNEFEILFNA